MAGRRLVPALGVAAVGGVGYYLYAAGGNPKVAEKKFERELTSITLDVRSELNTDIQMMLLVCQPS